MSQSQAKPEDGRLVFTMESDAQRYVDAALRLHQIGETELANFLMDASEAWDAAPSAPVEALTAAIKAYCADNDCNDPRWWESEMAAALSTALGVPFPPVEPGNTT